jgi:hypothetical protein
LNSPKFARANPAALCAIAALGALLTGTVSCSRSSAAANTDPAADLRLLLTSHNGSISITNTEGKLVLPAGSEWTIAPTELLAWGLKQDAIRMVFTNSKGEYLLLDKYGTQTRNPSALPISDFSEDLAAAASIHDFPHDFSKCGYIDRTHKVVIPIVYDGCLPFAEGLAVVRQGPRYGYVNREGKLAIPTQYLGASSFREGLAKVRLERGGAFINKSGNVAFTVDDQIDSFFHEGLAKIVVHDKVGYVDQTGKTVITATYSGGGNFSGGVAFVSYDEGMKLIGRQGREIPIPHLDYVYDFESGLARVKAGNKWGLLGPGGRFVVQPKYESIESFEAGLRKAQIQGKELVDFLDEEGNMVKRPAPLCFDYAHGVFTCALVSEQGIRGMQYLTRSGKRIG